MAHSELPLFISLSLVDGLVNFQRAQSTTILRSDCATSLETTASTLFISSDLINLGQMRTDVINDRMIKDLATVGSYLVGVPSTCERIKR